MKKITQEIRKAIAMLFLMMFCWVGYAAESWNYPASTPASPFGGGTGTSSDPYLINNAQQLANLAYMVNNGNTYTGKYFKLTQDIVLNDDVLDADGNLNSGSFKHWTPIGSSSYSFKGNFDGDNHSVSGLYINSGSDYSGLFGRAADGLITKVGVIDSYIYGGQYTAGILGHSDYCDVTYCYNYATVSGTFDIGGIIGDVCGLGGSASSRSNSVITACINYGKIVSRSNSCQGGITGYAYSNVTISYCANYGSVTGTSNHVGGIQGESGATIHHCINMGRVYSSGGTACPITESSSGSNNYYLAGTASGTGSGTSKPESEFSNGSVLALIDPSGEYFVAGPDGKPVLKDVGISVGLSVMKLVYSDPVTVVVPESTVDLGGWTSTNHTHSSTSEKTITFTAKADDVLRFNWSVSSESGCDRLYVQLDGSTVVNGVSGSQSSNFTRTFASDGSHTLYMYYSKDGSVHSGLDEGIVSNIRVTTPSSTNTVTDEEEFQAPIRREVEFASWTSTNKTHESTSNHVITFKASAEDILSFDWETSSELEGDVLNVNLDGTPIVVEQSGSGTSGNVSRTLTAGDHILYMEYVKDDAKSRYNDEVYVRNIKLTYAHPKHSFEKMVLQENFKSIEVYNPFMVDTLNYVRTFSNTDWQALYLPFSMSYEEWSEDFDVAFINAFHQYDRNADGLMDETELEVIKITNGALYPNYPYLIRAKETGVHTIQLLDAQFVQTKDSTIACSSMTYNYSFSGTHSRIAGSTLLSNGGYFLGGGQLIRPASGSSNLKPLRWYMNMESRDATYDHAAATIGSIRIRVQGEDFDENDAETAIESIAFDENYNSVENIYSIDGRRVKSDKLEKGIYIVGDKKVMIK